MEKIILASGSPRRKEILLNAGIPFEVCVSDAEECVFGSTPEEMVKGNALRKAKAVSEKFPGRVVLGADTVVVFDNNILGKPKDRSDAKRMLTLLSGKTHKVLTGVALTDGNRTAFDVEATDVHFRELSEEMIESYLATGECDDKAGSYGIQGKGGVFVEGITGDYFNVVGLPLCKVNRMLTDFYRKMPIDNG